MVDNDAFVLKEMEKLGLFILVSNDKYLHFRVNKLLAI